jgi:hypothetical protein
VCQSTATLAVSNTVNTYISTLVHILADREHFKMIPNAFVLWNRFIFVSHRKSKRLFTQRNTKNDRSGERSREYTCCIHMHTQFRICLHPHTFDVIFFTGAGWRSRYSDWLRTERPRRLNSSPGRGKIFLVCTSSRPTLGPNQSYPMSTEGSFSGGKAAEAWSWPLTSNLCRNQEHVDLYINPPYVYLV